MGYCDKKGSYSVVIGSIGAQKLGCLKVEVQWSVDPKRVQLAIQYATSTDAALLFSFNRGCYRVF